MTIPIDHLLIHKYTVYTKRIRYAFLPAIKLNLSGWKRISNPSYVIILTCISVSGSPSILSSVFSPALFPVITGGF